MIIIRTMGRWALVAVMLLVLLQSMLLHWSLQRGILSKPEADEPPDANEPSGEVASGDEVASWSASGEAS